MNRLPGESFPFGGVVAEPAGVIAAGDLVDDIDNPDKWARTSTPWPPSSTG